VWRPTYNCGMSKLKYDEARSFPALWSWLTGVELTDEELARIGNDPDPPDFQFTHEGKSVAVEHTQVFRPTDEASRQPLQDYDIQGRICDHLDRLLKQRDSQIPNVSLSVTFGSCHMVRKEDQSVIARGIFDLVSKRLERGDALPMELFMCDLEEISPCLGDVLVMEGATSSSVVRHGVGRVEEWGLGIFEDAARTKAEDLSKYSAEYDECWLLLSVGGPHCAQWIEPSSTACSRGIDSDFDRVFVVDHDHSKPKVHEIVVRN
jgi:hypothetical protein